MIAGPWVAGNRLGARAATITSWICLGAVGAIGLWLFHIASSDCPEEASDNYCRSRGFGLFWFIPIFGPVAASAIVKLARRKASNTNRFES